MSLHPDHLADLQKSGLSEKTITAANIDSIPPGDISKVLGKAYAEKINSLWAIPYPGNGFSRFKLFPSITDKQGHKLKYYQAAGSGVHLYFPPGVEDALINPNIPLCIVEGEKSLKGFSGRVNYYRHGGNLEFQTKGK